MFLLRPTRPCLTCGAPIPIERMPTALLPALGWRPYEVGRLRPRCGHVHAAVAYPAAGVPGWWTFLPLVGTGPRAAAVPAPRPDGLDFWAAAPGMGAAIEQDTDLQAIMATLQAELGHIRSLSDSEACRLCGVRAPLTEEHAPSRAAGNAGLIFGGRIDDAATKATGRVTWTDDVPAPDGATVQTLCAPCNKTSGRRYNPAYVALVKAAEPLARPANAGTHCQIGVVNRPLVAKQALTTLVATSQPGLTTRYRHLRDLLERPGSRGRLAPLRLSRRESRGLVYRHCGDREPRAADRPPRGELRLLAARLAAHHPPGGRRGRGRRFQLVGDREAQHPCDGRATLPVAGYALPD